MGLRGLRGGMKLIVMFWSWDRPSLLPNLLKLTNASGMHFLGFLWSSRGLGFRV